MDQVAVVIDNGSRDMKAGFAADISPASIFRSVVGHPKDNDTMIGLENSYSGNDATDMEGVLRINSPIQFGLISDWDDMEELWSYTFYNQLKIAPEEHPIMLTDAPLNPAVNREKMAEIMFEKYNTPYLFIQNQAVLSLFASGRCTGCVIESGDSVTHAVPVVDGTASANATIRLPYGGTNISQYLARMLTDRGYYFISPKEIDIARDIKEKLSYVALDFNLESAESAESADIEKSYEMPDGEIILLRNERFVCTEALFDPSVIDIVDMGIHSAAYECILRAEEEVRSELFGTIILGGGNCLFTNMSDRIEMEVGKLASAEVKVVSDPGIKYSTWTGGSIFAEIDSLRSTWVSRADYDEKSPLWM